MRLPSLVGFLWVLSGVLSAGTPGEAVHARVAKDVNQGNPIVVHVVVVLCDNRYQGIVPVPKALGNGQDPGSNLYWGAGYGVRTFLVRQGGWTLLSKETVPAEGRLERILLRKSIRREGKAATVFLVAEAWDGREIKAATVRFLALAAGRETEVLRVDGPNGPMSLHTGGASHLVAYVGHDGLMDFSLPLGLGPDSGAAALGQAARSSVVLACASQAFFMPHLTRGGSHPLLLTTNLMAPEAYTLDAAVTAWAQGGSAADVRGAAARAYATYQKIPLRSARRLFTGEP
jgi:hypothetical protein